jgi:hypothetical protein
VHELERTGSDVGGLEDTNSIIARASNQEVALARPVDAENRALVDTRQGRDLLPVRTRITSTIVSSPDDHRLIFGHGCNVMTNRVRRKAPHGGGVAYRIAS